MFSQTLQLNIEGSTKYETKVIDSIGYIKMHHNFSSIQTQIDSVQKTFYNIGYIENKYEPIIKVNDSVFFTKFHLKTKYEKIHINYNKDLINSKLLNTFSKKVTDTYFIISISEVEAVLNLINLKMTEKGFPFTQLKLSDITISNNQELEANLLIATTENKRQISNIVLKGYENFPKSYLKYYLKIKPKQTFNLNDIKSKTNTLSNLRFVSELKSPEVLFSKDSTTLYLYLQKNKSNTFDGFLGFGTNENNNKLKFDGYLNLILTNNLNYGESFRLLYKSDENDQKNFETSLNLPYILQTPIGLDVGLRIFKRDSSFNTVNQSVKLNYLISPRHKVFAGINESQSSNLLNDNSNNATILDYKTSYTTFAYEFNKQKPNNFIFPQDSKFYFETNFGNRKQSSQKEKQTLIQIDGFKIFNLNYKNSIFIRFNSGSLISNSYFENELLRFGGINSIRGFEENSLYASLFGLLNTEYRYQLSSNLYIHSITDTAYFENKITDINKKLYSYGIGLGLLSKSGLFKLNFASQVTDNKVFTFYNSKIHISFISTF